MAADNDLVQEYNHFIKTLQPFKEEWLMMYFDLMKRLLQDLNLNNDSLQLAMTVTKNHDLNTNIGQRWVSKPYYDESLCLILPITTNARDFDCISLGHFTKNGSADALWVNFIAKEGMPEPLYQLWLAACYSELHKVKTKSGFRKSHSSLFYDTVTKEEAREEIFKDLFNNKQRLG